MISYFPLYEISTGSFCRVLGELASTSLDDRRLLRFLALQTDVNHTTVRWSCITSVLRFTGRGMLGRSWRST